MTCQSRILNEFVLFHHARHMPDIENMASSSKGAWLDFIDLYKVLAKILDHETPEARIVGKKVIWTSSLKIELRNQGEFSIKVFAKQHRRACALEMQRYTRFWPFMFHIMPIT